MLLHGIIKCWKICNLCINPLCELAEVFFHRGECTISPGTKNVPKSFIGCECAMCMRPFSVHSGAMKCNSTRGFWAIFFNLNIEKWNELKYDYFALKVFDVGILEEMYRAPYTVFSAPDSKFSKIVLVKLEFYLLHSFRFHSLLFLIFSVCLLYNTFESRWMWQCGTEAAATFTIMPIANHVFIFQIQTFDGKCRLKKNFERNQPASLAK